MEEVIQRAAVILLLFVPLANGGINCGVHYCAGSNAYCCGSDYFSQCCWSTSVYQLWWFWVIWVVVFFLVLACSLACWRRRRAQYRYTVMTNSQYPGYGTVVHTSNTIAQSATMPPQYVPPSAPVGPPVYTVSEKPPAYSR